MSGIDENDRCGEVVRPLIKLHSCIFTVDLSIFRRFFIMERLFGRITTKMIARVSILTAISVILKVYLSVTDGPNWRFTIFGIPLIIIGLMYRPHVAVIAGFTVDFIYVLLSPFAFTFNFMTLEAISFALIPSLVVMYYEIHKEQKIDNKGIVFSVVVAALLGFMFNTYQLSIWFGRAGITPFIPLRFGFTLINMVLASYVSVTLYGRLFDYGIVEIYE